MAGFNLIRKRRRRLPIKKILLGTLAVVVLAGGGYLGVSLLRKGGILMSADNQVDLRTVDVSPLTGFRPDPEGDALDYTAIDEKAGKFARGAQVTFTMLAKGAVAGTVKLHNLGLEVKSFQPLDKVTPAPTYEAPIGRTGGESEDFDVQARLRLGEGQKSTITWTAQTGFAVTEGDHEAGTLAQGKTKVQPFLPASAETLLSTINRPEPKSFASKIVLESPGVATVALWAEYDIEGSVGTSRSESTFTLVYNPGVDVGSLPYIEGNYKHAPTFAHARVYRDALLKAEKKDEALELAQDYRRADPGPDADWLVGDTYRTMGQFQKAADEGFYPFYRFDQEFTGDRLARWQEAKAWLTEKVQAGEITRPKE